MDGYGLESMYEGHGPAMQKIERGLAEAATAYNNNAAFMREQPHSAGLREFFRDMDGSLHRSRGQMGRLGISLSQNGEVHFSAEAFRQLDRLSLRAAINANMQFFDTLYQRTGEVLSVPLSEHMQFKSLSYHYNYQMGKMIEDGFGLIESGLIIDKKL
jgi:hypothetical protein